MKTNSINEVCLQQELKNAHDTKLKVFFREVPFRIPIALHESMECTLNFLKENTYKSCTFVSILTYKN